MKLFKILIITAMVKSMIFASGVTNESLSQLETFKNIKAKVTGHALIGKNLDLYLVKGTDGSGRPFEVITDSKGNYLILSSKVFDVKNQASVSIPMDVSPLKGKELFTYGTGKKIYYVFTDPECPFCHKFEAKWEGLKDKVQFKVFYFNLDFHKEANAMSRWVLSAKTNEEKIQRHLSLSKGNTTYKEFKLSASEIDRLNKILADSKALGMTLGIQGTPTVIDTKGNVTPWPNL